MKIWWNSPFLLACLSIWLSWVWLPQSCRSERKILTCKHVDWYGGRSQKRILEMAWPVSTTSWGDCFRFHPALPDQIRQCIFLNLFTVLFQFPACVNYGGAHYSCPSNTTHPQSNLGSTTSKYATRTTCQIIFCCYGDFARCINPPYFSCPLPFQNSP